MTERSKPSSQVLGISRGEFDVRSLFNESQKYGNIRRILRSYNTPADASLLFWRIILYDDTLNGDDDDLYAANDPPKKPNGNRDTEIDCSSLATSPDLHLYDRLLSDAVSMRDQKTSSIN